MQGATVDWHCRLARGPLFSAALGAASSWHGRGALASTLEKRMSSVIHNGNSPVAPMSARIARKVWREVSRPVRRLSRRLHEQRAQPASANDRERHNFV